MSGLDSLKSKLNRYIRAFYARRVLRGLVFWSGLSLSTLLIWMVLEHIGRFPSGIRALMFWAYLGLFTAWLLIYVFFPLLKMMRWLRGIDYRTAAQNIGLVLEGMDHKIQDALSLKVDEQDKALSLAALEQKLDKLENVDFNAVLDWGDLKRSLPYLIVPVVVLLLLMQWSGGREVLDSSRRLVYYNQDFIPPAPFNFILPDNQKVLSGANLELEVELKGEQIPSTISATIAGNEVLPVKIGAGRWMVKLENLREDAQVKFEALGYSSEAVSIKVVQKPVIAGVNLRIVPPAYTGLPKEEIPLSGLHRVAVGSTVELELKGASNLNQAFLVREDTSLSFMGGSLGLRVMESETFGLLLNNQEVSIDVFQGSRFQVKEDLAPEVEIISMDSVDFMAWALSLNYGDDYGIRSLERVLVLDGKERVVKLQINKAGTFRDQLALDSLSEHYTSISLYYRVWDNNAVFGSSSATTKRLNLALKSREEVLKEQAEELRNYSSSTSERKQSLEELNKELESLQEDLVDRKNLDWKAKQDIKDKLKALDNQRKTAIEQREKLEKTLESLKEESLQKEEVQERLKELNKEEERLKDLEDEIRELMDMLDMKELKEKLKELQQENKEQLRRDERLDELLEDLLFQRDLLREAERLKDLSEQLQKQAERDDLDAEETQQAKQDLEESLEQLEQLAEQNSQLSEKLNSEEFKKASEEAKEALEQASEQKQNQKASEANDSEQKASEQTQEMSESLSSLMMQMQSQALQMNMESLRRLLESVKQYSLDVEDNGLEVSELGKDDPRYRFLLREQSRLLAGAEVIRDSLVVLANKAPQIKDEVFKELSKMMSTLESAREHLQEQEKPQSAVQHQYSMMAANTLALMLDNSLQNMMSMMAMQKEGNQNCEKPGGAKPKPGQMSKQLSQMGEKVDKLEKGNQEGKGKNGKGSKEIAEIMSEQEALRRMIQESEAEESGAGGNGDKEQEELLEELDKMEDLLLDRDLGRYKERLKRIETRLLENERANEERKQKEQREAETRKGSKALNGDAKDKIEKAPSIEKLTRDRLQLVPFYNRLSGG